MNSITRSIKVATLAVGLGVTLLGATAGNAATIYDNTTGDLGIRYEVPAGYEVGNEIVLNPSDPLNRRLSEFSFEFWATNSTSGTTLAGQVGVTLSLYKSDGPSFNGYASPGTLLWQSTPYFLASGSLRDTLNYTEAGDFGYNVVLPSTNLVWTVKFSYTDAGNHAGLDIYAQPTIGDNMNDIWQFTNASAGWELFRNSSGLSNSFAAKVDATPEPAALWLLGVGGLLGFAMVRRRIRGN